MYRNRTLVTGSKGRLKAVVLDMVHWQNSSLNLMKIIFLDQLNRDQLNCSLSLPVCY